MAVIILPYRWRIQPQYPVAVNWGNPLTKGLQRAFIPSADLVDLAGSGNGLTYTGEVSRSYDSGMQSWKQSAAVVTNIATLPWSSTGESSALWVQRSHIGSSAGTRWCEIGSSSNADHWPYTGGQMYSDVFWSARWVNNVLPPTGRVATATHVLGMSVKSGKQVAYYDGIPWVDSATAGTYTLPATLYLHGNINFGSGMHLFGVWLWNRALTAAELYELTVNPWQLFRPLQRRIYVGAAAGAVTYTQTASLAAAIRLARSATASLGAALQTPRSETASLAAAIQKAQSAAASLQSAIQSADVASITLAAAVQEARSLTASLDASISEFEARYGRPIADISAGAWTPSSGGDLYAMIDEVSPDDGDYILTTTATTCEVRLTALADPGTSGGHTLKARIPAGFVASGSLTIDIVQGTTVLDTWAMGAISADTTYSRSLSGAVIDSITDYTDLRLRFTAAA